MVLTIARDAVIVTISSVDVLTRTIVQIIERALQYQQYQVFV